MSPLTDLLVRDARPGDHASVVDFNLRLAEESEGKKLDRAVVGRGVALALAEPDRLRYWVAEATAKGVAIGQAAITREWSDWRNGWVWWLQSVYVEPASRGQGVFRALYTHIRQQAWHASDVIGLRLYVEQDNQSAQVTYQRLGMRPGGYHVYEELWPERFTAPRD